MSAIPLPPSIATATDPRYLVYLTAPQWQIALHAALNAPLLEEVLFRAPLLALAATLTAHRTRPAHRRLILLSASLVSAILFALAHAGAGPGNVVVALISAVTLTVLALRTRSLIPGIAAHAAYNILTFTL
jgi:membrane protease YdiL (CAAX protease family)